MEPESSLPYSQLPATCPYPEPTPSSPQNPLHFLKVRLNVILPSTSGSPQWSPSLWLPSPRTLCTTPPSPIRSTDYYTPHCVIFPFPCYLVPLRSKYLLTPYAQIPSAYVPPSMSATKFHTHTEQRAIL